MLVLPPILYHIGRDKSLGEPELTYLNNHAETSSNDRGGPAVSYK